MLGRDKFLLSFALLTAAAAGCGGAETASSGGGGAGTTTTSTTTTSMGGTTTTTTTTEEGGAATCPKDEFKVFAVSELAFGEGNAGQWKKVGFDLDNRASTSSSTDLCMPAAGAATNIPYPDGENGIDNSFGKNLLPLLVSLYSNWGENVNNGIANGVFTSLLKLECLPAEGDIPVMNTKLFGGTSLGAPAKMDGTDKWPITPEILSDPLDADSSTVVFPKSSVKGDLFDSGLNQTFILTIPLKTANAESSIKLTLYNAHTTMVLSPDRKSATEGMIGGVLNTEELLGEVNKIGALIGICGSDIFKNILNTVRQASDIMADGTQDPTKTCDGITAGLSFKMVQAQLGEVGPPTVVGQVCPP